MSENKENNFWEGATIIDAYTRKQAIEDGVLIDLMQPETAHVVREAGFKWPMAMTATAFAEAVWPVDDAEATELLKRDGQSVTGRLWDMLWMLRVAIQRGTFGVREEVRFEVLVQQPRPDGKPVRRRRMPLKCLAGPDDDGGPCLTVMLPDED